MHYLRALGMTQNLARAVISSAKRMWVSCRAYGYALRVSREISPAAIAAQRNGLRKGDYAELD